MGFTQTMIVGTVGSIAAILAAGFWLRASRVHVPDDIDNIINIISALQSASQLNSYAAKAASWQVKDLVEATPTSIPAWVKKVIPASRVMVLSGTLTIAAVGNFLSLQWRSAIRVSSVSPDW